jgi:methanogenic corrinoid protein MtbC1
MFKPFTKGIHHLRNKTVKMTSGKYTVNQAEERTMVPAATLRQWERRYGFPMPERASSGYRLYSDADLLSIEEMKRHIAAGVPASRAAVLAREPIQIGGEQQGLLNVRSNLVDALVNLDERRAEIILGEAYAMYPMEAVISEIVHGTMVDVGVLWHDGSIPITTEHFASNFMQGRLRLLLIMPGATVSYLGVIVACAPQEMHELGALTLAVLLRRAGYQIYFTGASTPIADLVEMAGTVNPIAVLISATTSESILTLRKNKDRLSNLAPRLLFFGGGVFNEDPSEAERLGGHFLAATASTAVEAFNQLINQRRSSRL